MGSSSQLMTLVQVSYYPQHILPLFSSLYTNNPCLVPKGPGPVARRLAHHFDRVVVSDAGKANIEAAKDMLSSASTTENRSKFTFLNTPAESIHNSVPPSIDFTSVASTFVPHSRSNSTRFLKLFPGSLRAQECSPNKKKKYGCLADGEVEQWHSTISTPRMPSSPSHQH